ncbi:SHC SH2 domain-binding protein 1-like [Antedon mediterranea]|uniref:SHC SH2 domain-binding protein 1-like n=1 Tax=Antedon mediterranea TaxID=105859 RepID=UPI003AF8B1F4
MEGDNSFSKPEDCSLNDETIVNSSASTNEEGNESMQCDLTPEKPIVGTPNIYQLVSPSFDDHFNEISSILTFHKPFEIEDRLIEFLESKPLRCDWNAVWRCENPEVDILVKVVKIYTRKFMTASIKIHDCFDFGDDSENLRQQVHEYIQATNNKVLLLDLYPVCSDNDDGHLRELASAIEQFRFFYDFVWRVTDEEDNDECVYATRSLHPRLKLYYEMKMNATSVDAKKYTEVIHEYQTVYRELLRRRLALVENEGSDSELSELDLIEITNLYECLVRLSQTLSVMETPALRMLFSSGGTKSATYPSCEARGARSDRSTVTHIVCDKLKAYMVQSLQSDTEIMHHKSLDAALQSSFDGDDVMLYPGTYSSWALSNMHQSISIKGVGETALVVIDTEDIPVEISSYKFVMENVMLTCDSSASSEPVLGVKRGTSELRRCMLQGGTVGVLAHSPCSLIIKNCSIQGATKAGLLIKQGCSVELTDSTIVQCGSGQQLKGADQAKTGGIMIEMNDTNDGDEKATISWKNNKMIENYDYDICLVSDDATERVMTCRQFLNYPQLNVDLAQDNDLKEHKIGIVGSRL